MHISQLKPVQLPDWILAVAHSLAHAMSLVEIATVMDSVLNVVTVVQVL